MRTRRRKRRNIGTYVWAAVLSAVVLVIVLLGVRADKAVRPVAGLRARHFAEVCAENIVEQAVSDYLRENEYTYSDFAAVLYNDGRAVSIETIPYNINKVQAELASAVNHKLADSGTISDRIPVGSLTGSFLLAGKGPKLKVKICPVGIAETEIRSEMESAGINQTRHRISAVITVKLSSSLPLYSFDSEVKFGFLLAETVIIGEVPDFTPYVSTNR